MISIHVLNLFTTSNLIFGNNDVIPIIVSDSEIKIVISAGISTGSIPIMINSVGGYASGSTYNCVESPTIATISPKSGSSLG